MKWTVLTLVCLVTLFGRSASAQEMVAIPPLPHVDVSGPYLWGLGGHEIIHVKASADGRNPYERCALMDARTVEILNRTQAPPLRRSDIRVMSKGGRDMIVVRKYYLTDVKAADAKAENTSTSALAQKWARSVQRALPDVAPKPGKFGV
jgi:hypothetical protein